MAPRSENEHVEQMDNNFSSRVSRGSKEMITAGPGDSSPARPFTGSPGQLPVLTGGLLVPCPVGAGAPGVVGFTVTVGPADEVGPGEALGSPLCDGETLGTPVGCGDGETLGTTDGEAEGPGIGADSLV